MISKVIDYIPDELITRTPQSEVIAPSFAELNELAKIDGIDKRVVTVYDESNTLAACAVCSIEDRRHHGIQLKVYSLFGYLVHDYCRIFCSSANAMRLLKKAIVKDAKKQGADIIIWSNIPSELIPDGTLPIHTEIKIFDANKSDLGWSRFYKSKHVKYSLNRARKINGDYHVDVIDGYVPDDLMERFAQMHISRWRFAGSVSPFSFNHKRKDEYRAHPANKHYLGIYAGEELIACHYGMRYGKSLLFHTPIINPKYLELSPMKLILAETARYCEANGLELIDFGHGDEAYKDGYCTLPRHTCNFERAISMKGYLALAMGKIQKHLNLDKLRNTKSPKKECSTSKYELTVNSNIPDDAPMLSSWTEFCDFCTKYNLPIYKWQYDNFRYKRMAIAVISDDKKVDFFWKDDQRTD